MKTKIESENDSKLKKIDKFHSCWARQNKMLTLSWLRPISCRNQSIDLGSNQWTGFYMISASVMKCLKSACLADIKTKIQRQKRKKYMGSHTVEIHFTKTGAQYISNSLYHKQRIQKSFKTKITSCQTLRRLYILYWFQ